MFCQGAYMPVVSINLIASDGWIDNSAWDKTTMMPSHWDASTSIAFSDTDDVWTLMFFARNLNSVDYKYFSEFDTFDEDGVSSVQFPLTALTNYGVRIGYKF